MCILSHNALFYNSLVCSKIELAHLDLNRLIFINIFKLLWCCVKYFFQIYEYYQDFEGAKCLLENYRKNNPNNPNSHRFLFELLQRNAFCFEDDVIEERLSCLQVQLTFLIMERWCHQ